MYVNRFSHGSENWRTSNDRMLTRHTGLLEHCLGGCDRGEGRWLERKSRTGGTLVTKALMSTLLNRQQIIRGNSVVMLEALERMHGGGDR